MSRRLQKLGRLRVKGKYVQDTKEEEENSLWRRKIVRRIVSRDYDSIYYSKTKGLTSITYKIGKQFSTEEEGLS